MKLILSSILFVIAITTFIIDLSGMHGNLMFRTDMLEDWIIWSIIIISFLGGSFLFISALKKSGQEK